MLGGPCALSAFSLSQPLSAWRENGGVSHRPRLLCLQPPPHSPGFSTTDRGGPLTTTTTSLSPQSGRKGFSRTVRLGASVDVRQRERRSPSPSAPPPSGGTFQNVLISGPSPVSDGRPGTDLLSLAAGALVCRKEAVMVRRGRRKHMRMNDAV